MHIIQSAQKAMLNISILWWNHEFYKEITREFFTIEFLPLRIRNNHTFKIINDSKKALLQIEFQKYKQI